MGAWIETGHKKTPADAGAGIGLVVKLNICLHLVVDFRGEAEYNRGAEKSASVKIDG